MRYDETYVQSLKEIITDMSKHILFITESNITERENVKNLLKQVEDLTDKLYEKQKKAKSEGEFVTEKNVDIMCDFVNLLSNNDWNFKWDKDIHRLLVENNEGKMIRCFTYPTLVEAMQAMLEIN